MRSERWSPIIKRIWWRPIYDSTLYPTCASSRARASAYTYPSLQTSQGGGLAVVLAEIDSCLLYTSPSPRDRTRSRMPSSA